VIEFSSTPKTFTDLSNAIDGTSIAALAAARTTARVWQSIGYRHIAPFFWEVRFMFSLHAYRGGLPALAISLAGALSVGLATGPAPATAEASPPGSAPPIQLTLPTPTGPDRIGTVALHLVDPSRRDPWIPGHPLRELMVSLWYPATQTARSPVAPWMLPGAAARALSGLGIRQGAVKLPVTAGHLDAPVDRGGGARPVLLYSPGLQANRTIDTALVQELASRGYIVVTIDHTHDAGEVEFPGGRVEVAAMPPRETPAVKTEAVAVREADTRFVLDQLTAIDHGANPSVEHTALPRGIAGAMDLSRIGMFGWSIGGATAAATMRDDPRIKAGANMDGTFYGPVATSGLDRPFLLFGSQDHNRDNDPSWASFWAHLRGWRLDLKLTGAQHSSFTDAQYLEPQLAGLLRLSASQLAQDIGTIKPGRALDAERSYLLAFFDQQLRHRHSKLLDGPSPRYPQVQFLP
jgi:predicted dienelactone hydrolase